MSAVHTSWYVFRAALRDRMLLFVLPAALPLPLLGNTRAAWMAFGLLAFTGLLQATRPSLFERALPVDARVLLLGKISARSLLILLPVAAWIAVTWWRNPAGFSWALAYAMLALGMVVVSLPFAVDGFSLNRSVQRAQAEPASGVSPPVSGRAALVLTPLSVALIFAHVELSASAFAWLTGVLAVMSSVAAFVVWPGSVTAPLARPVDRGAAVRAAAPPSPDPAMKKAGVTRRGSNSFSTTDELDSLPRASTGGDRWSIRDWLALLYPSTKARVMAVFLAVVVMLQGLLQVEVSQWAVLLMVSPTALVSGTGMLATLPFSPRRRLWAITIAGPLMLVASYCIGFALPAPYGESLSDNSPRAKEPGKWYDNATEVRLTFWTYSSDGTVPTITAPWGEVVEPFTVRVLGKTFYNAYTVKRASSERFVNWQLERLTTVAFGTPVSAADLRAGNTPPLVTRRWPVMLVCAGLAISFALLASFGAWMARGAPMMSVHALWIWLVNVPMFVNLYLQVGTDAGYQPLGSLALKGILALLEALPPQPVLYVGGVLLLALTPVALMALLLDRASRQPRVEFTPPVR